MFTALLFTIVAVLIGGLVVLQSGVNYQLSLTLGGESVFAVCVSMSMASLTILWPTLKVVKSEKWILLYRELKNKPRLRIILSAGALGSIYLFGSIVISPVIGYGLFFMCVIFGELLTSLLVDYYGFCWSKPRPVGKYRLLGVLLVFGGVVTFQWESLSINENVNVWEAIGSAAISIICGMCLIVQSSFNQQVALMLGHAFGATWLSLFLAAVLTFIAGLFILSRNSLRVQRDNPWDHLWLWTGGSIGSVCLWSFTYLPTEIGMVMTFICVVLGQIMGALVFDALGLFGFEVRTVTVKRLAGVVLSMAGVILANMKVVKSSLADEAKIEYIHSELHDSCGNEVEVEEIVRRVPAGAVEII